jgi:hypothetical protein
MLLNQQHLGKNLHYLVPSPSVSGHPLNSFKQQRLDKHHLYRIFRLCIFTSKFED